MVVLTVLLLILLSLDGTLLQAGAGKSDFIDCVNLDGWTMDFICARRSGQTGHGIDGYNSRRGVGPIETYKGWGSTWDIVR